MARPSRVFVIVSSWSGSPGEVVGSLRRVQRYVRQLMLREAPVLPAADVSVFDEYGEVVFEASSALVDGGRVELRETLYLKGDQWRNGKRRQ